MKFIIPILLLLASCSPVSRVLNNDEMFKRVADSVVARGYCVNDTVTLVKILEVEDTSEYEVETIIDQVPCPDFVAKKGSTTVTSKRGKMKIKDTCVSKEKTITLVHTETVRDRKLEDHLKGVIVKDAKVITTLKKDLQKSKNSQRKKLLIAFISGIVFSTASRFIPKLWT